MGLASGSPLLPPLCSPSPEMVTSKAEKASLGLAHKWSLLGVCYEAM
jgi:hypothetical protein